MPAQKHTSHTSMASMNSLPRMGSMQNINDRPPLRLLSLDGGGVRGYSMLMLLQEVMLKTFVEMHGRAPKRDEIPRPCDHFDLIGGTGTGGIIAILLGRMRFDIETCLEIYTEMTENIFVSDKTIAKIPYGKTLYKASKLEEAFKLVQRGRYTDDLFDQRLLKRTESVLGSNSSSHRSREGVMNGFASPSGVSLRSVSSAGNDGQGKRSSYSTNQGSGTGACNSSVYGGSSFQGSDLDNLPLYDDREGRCKTFVTAVYKGAAPDTPPALLRTYDSSIESSPCGDCTCWQAGRATSAIYPAFKPIQIGQVIFSDDGNGKFNPVTTVIGEARNEWPDRDIGVLVSIGSGKLPESVANASQQESRLKKAFIKSTPLNKLVQGRDAYISKIGDCETIHQNLVEDIDTTGFLRSDCYFRLNVDSDVGASAQNEYQRLADISTNTRTYLSQPKIQQQNRDCAQKLAAIHSMRQADGRLSTPTNDKRALRPVPIPSHLLTRGLPALPNSSHLSQISQNGPYPIQPLNPTPPYMHKRNAIAPLNTAPKEAKIVVPREPSEMWDSEGEDEEISRHIAGLKKIAESIEEEERRRDFERSRSRGRSRNGELRDSFGRSESPAFSDDACELAYCYNGLGIAMSR